jgi:hypothetical protein
VRSVQVGPAGRDERLGVGQQGGREGGGLPVDGEFGGRRVAGRVVARRVERQGFAGEGLVLAEAVQDGGDTAGDRRVVPADGGDPLQVAVGPAAALVVDGEGVCPVVGQAGVVTDEQHVGHLGVHAGQRDVAVGRGRDLWGGALAELVEATAERADDGGDHDAQQHGGHHDRAGGQPDRRRWAEFPPACLDPSGTDCDSHHVRKLSMGGHGTVKVGRRPG